MTWIRTNLTVIGMTTAGLLALATGVFVATALAASPASEKTVTVEVATNPGPPGETGPAGPAGPQGPKGDPGGVTCPDGFSPGELTIKGNVTLTGEPTPTKATVTIFTCIED